MAKKHLKDSLAEYMVQKIAAQAEKESRKLLKHISAIYRVDAAGNTEQFGTGVFLNVLVQASSGGFSLVQPGLSGPIPLLY